MSEFGDYVLQYLPVPRKHNTSGWISFNCPVCIEMGETIDNRMRGGFFDNEYVSLKCFNCNFKVSWSEGKPISKKWGWYLSSIGCTKDEISRLYLIAMKDQNIVIKEHNMDVKSLPEDARPLTSWLNEPSDDFLKVIDYISNRNIDMVDWYDFYWSPTKTNNLNKRFIIPVYRNSSIIGWTARSITKLVKPKYYNNYQKNCIFNQNILNSKRKIIPIVEGPLDAISIDGIGLFGNSCSPEQLKLLRNYKKDYVVVPDKDRPGLKLIETALENNWYVSFPEWDVKDCFDAVKKYGRVITIAHIIEQTERSKLKIRLKTKSYIKEVNDGSSNEKTPDESNLL